MTWSKKKIAVVAGGTVIGGSACFLSAGALAPAVGTLIGTYFMGLSGAAATSAGLAALGGGAVAAGGGGMAAGASVVATTVTSSGALLGALGMGTVANFFRDSSNKFQQAITVEKDVAKAQEIILKQEERIRDLERDLASERRRQDENELKIARLEQTIKKLNELVEQERGQLRLVT